MGASLRSGKPLFQSLFYLFKIRVAEQRQHLHQRIRFQWWNLEPDALVEVLPLLCDPDLEKVKQALKERLSGTK